MSFPILTGIDWFGIFGFAFISVTGRYVPESGGGGGGAIGGGDLTGQSPTSTNDGTFPQPEKNVCNAMAVYAQQLADEAIVQAGGSNHGAVSRFDRAFSQAYLGNDGIGSTLLSAWEFSRKEVKTTGVAYNNAGRRGISRPIPRLSRRTDPSLCGLLIRWDKRPMTGCNVAHVHNR
jgi:hypothetical protein